MRILYRKKKQQENASQEKDDKKAVKSLEENVKKIKESLKDCGDIIYKEFHMGREQKLSCMLIYTDGMTDKVVLNDDVLNALMLRAREVEPELPEYADEIYNLILYGALPASEIKEIQSMDDAILAILLGDAVLFIDGIGKIIEIGAKGWPMRSVAEPNTETLIRGPRDGFTETFRVNTALVRRRIRDPQLKLLQMQVGRRSRTDVGVLYIEDIALPPLVEEVVRRIKTIDIDGVLESGYIEQLIEDDYLSPFPQMRVTERPDEAAAALLEGRVVILVDNSPFALVLPTTLNGLFQSPEDYYDRWYIATVLRMLRYTASIISLTLPAIYIAVTSFHPGILPSKLVLSIAASREGIPFPALIEAFLMEATFELLREAGIRLPAPIGSTIGIVGGIVIGTAAVQAGIVSPIMVIIVAITAIASFTIPNYALSIGIRMLRFVIMLLAGVLGLYGIMLGLMLILSHMAKLKSFGIPYLSPYASFVAGDYKDSFVRVPLFLMKTRPYNLTKNKTRLKDNRNEINQVEPGGNTNDKK